MKMASNISARTIFNFRPPDLFANNPSLTAVEDPLDDGPMDFGLMDQGPIVAIGARGAK